MIVLCGRFCAKLHLGVDLLSASELSVAHIWSHLADGRQAVYDQVIDSMRKPALKPEIMFQLLHNTVDILGGHRADLKLSPSIEIWPLVAVLRRSNEKRYQEIAQQFVEQFTDRKSKLTFFFCVAHVWPHLADGRWQGVYNEGIEELKKAALEPEITFQLLHTMVDILGDHRANLKLSPSMEICPLVADLRRSNEKRYQETAQQFVEQFTDRK